MENMEAREHTARKLVKNLSSVSEQTRIDALCSLRLITKHDPESRHVFAESGCIPYLAECLYSDSAICQENSAAALLNLSLSGRDPLMDTPGLLDGISHVLRNPKSAEAAQAAAAVVYSLLTVDRFRRIIGSKHDVIYALIDIIRNPNSHVRTNKDALKALFGISLYPPNRTTVIELGAVPALFTLVVSDGRVGILEDATAVVAQIAGCEDAEAAFNKASGIYVLSDLLNPLTGSSTRTKENVVSALLNLVKCSDERVAEKVRDLVAAGLGGIADVAKHGSPKGQSKAAALLRVLDPPGSENVMRDLHLESSYSSTQCSS